MVRVVCFDVGGVLIRITHHWQKAAECAGIRIGDAVPAGAVLTDAPHFETFQRGEISDDTYLEGLAKYLGGIKREEALSIHNRIMMEPYPGVEQLVRSINDTGILTGCLSNTNGPHWHDMFHSGRFPANELLTVRLASHEVGLEKPDPRIFARFEDRCAVGGSEIAFFDDSPLNVEAASRLGWQSWIIDPNVSTVPQMEHFLSEAGISLECSGHL